MIVTCPNCETRFEVDPEKLGEEGRKVRCGECSSVWLQPREEESDDDELYEDDVLNEDDDIEDESEDIAFIDMVENDDEPASAPAIDIIQGQPSSTPSSSDRKGHTGGRIAAGILFIFVLAGLWMLKPTITQAWPAMHSVYGIFGNAETVLSNNDISFERFDVLQSGQVLEINGMIYNLKDEAITLPPLKISMKNKAGDVLESKIITLPQPVIEQEATKEFSRMIDLITDQSVTSIEIRPVTFYDHDMTEVHADGAP